ncbi:MAG TPA: monovalent cation/H+ antiporter subunit D [Chiayiivirga sp.]|uniref:Monovalent cation/H+ antiporter subunit D n=1 Tax=Denitratimonas tolerans TaxID=1338420 RepID=A0AAW9QZG1_9GAMM|nr:monovalent cation/H+ antiporter subunit D [Chiayiivirga sp.]HRN59201.1 monovalent cation/H+ antiporter subunit D [Chiayiivirga sp.]HRO86434.1 monovalent cation/H+ antiporter subunit D [Chiayiivirga sp.]HRQ34254.1 monovalent cation/H+ antiporter subunit D [Chiayiivirga sp.]
MSAHLPVLPIVWPLVMAALMLLVERRGIALQRALAWLGAGGLLLLSIALVRQADTGDITVYLLGDWPARLGIALMVDRLSAWMVLVTSLLGAACLLHASSGWDRRAPHFHALFQLQLMGLNGAFLTGDLFNLFVFFEILLAASYGLLLSGARGGRIRTGFHYVVFNVAASTLFLIGLGMMYGLLGTLNMAELAAGVATVAPQDRFLLQAAAGLLLVVFCAKGAVLPLYLWLPATYGRAQPAVAALLVIMTKVGAYAVLRVFSLLFGAEAGDLAGFAWDWLLPAGIATLLMAGLGTLAAVRLRILAGYVVLASSGTLFIAFSLATAQAIGAGLYYLAHSTFAAAALFLIVALVRRHRITDRTNVVLPIRDAWLSGGLYFVAAIALIGLPPLSGFIGKFTVLMATPAPHTAWVWSTVLATSFFMLVAMTRAGSRLFWLVPSEPAPAAPSRARPTRAPRREVVAIVLLLGYGVIMTVAAGPLLDYTRAAGEQLVSPRDYIEAMRTTLPRLREP